MKYYGKAEGTAQKIVKAFENNMVPDALANVFITGANENNAASYSLMNRFIVAIHGYSDARGFKSWIKVNRCVMKGQKAFTILAPVFATKKAKDLSEKDSKILIGFRGVPVFGLEQTDGEPLENEKQVDSFIESLPLLDVAKKWGIDVSAYNGKNRAALGMYFSGLKIQLGTENISTWAHELAHAADDKLGFLKEEKSRAISEVVAEFAGAVLLKCIGMDVEADMGGAYDYIKSWSRSIDMDPVEACSKVLSRVCKVVDLILETANKSEEVEAQ